jgi:hypothetical protein
MNLYDTAQAVFETAYPYFGRLEAIAFTGLFLARLFDLTLPHAMSVALQAASEFVQSHADPIKL